MRSIARYSAAACVMALGVSAGKFRNSEYAALGEIPTQTAAGNGLPIFDVVPTKAPSLELLKKRIEERQFLTNTCTEWTILGGNGQPVCYNSQTCLFSTVGNLRYEGCGLTSVAYDWITECYNYGKAGTAGVSQTFCPSTAPACGVFEFRFDASITFSNFGCATASYSYIATLLSSGTIDIAVGSSQSSLRPSGTIYVTETPSNRVDPSNIPNGGVSPTPVPPSGGSSTPIGAIVGGVIGGVAVVALLGFIAWYCMRKRKQDKEAAAATAQQQADSATAVAYHNAEQTRMSEMDGSSTLKPGGAAFAPPLPGNHFAPTPEKNEAAVGGAQEQRPGLHPHYSSGYSETPVSASGSPLPVYPQPNQHQVSSPSSQYTELDPTTARHSSVGGPISPGTGTYMSTGNVSELGDNRASYQAYHPGGQSPPPPPLPEMEGVSSSSGGINRRPVGTQQQHVDMSGNPLNSDYRPHELP